MASGRIFHYTTLESLALILKARTLRFTRLDCVDDVREAQQLADINVGQYFFVSCWTREENESIPQWNMYSKEMQGVRIELPAHPFSSDQLVIPPGWGGLEWKGNLVSPMKFEELWGAGHFVVPNFLKPEHFAGDVEYVPSVEEEYKRSARVEHHPDGSSSFKADALYKLPRYKSLQWKFQDEYRFSLFVFPSTPVPTVAAERATYFSRIHEYQTAAFFKNVDPGIKHIDVRIEPTVLTSLVVRTGPLCTAGTRACVEALLAHFAPGARIESSALTGEIRARVR